MIDGYPKQVNVLATLQNYDSPYLIFTKIKEREAGLGLESFT